MTSIDFRNIGHVGMSKEMITLNPPSGNLRWTKPFWISDMRLFITSPSSSFPFWPLGDGFEALVPLDAPERKIYVIKLFSELTLNYVFF